jgi:hypothetical protein
VDDDFLPLVGGLVLDCYFQVFSKHLRGVFLQLSIGEFDHELPLKVFLSGKGGYVFIGGGGAGGSEGIGPSLFVELGTHLLESLPLVVVDLIPTNLVLKLLRIL